jgi:lon-related putative ATP-dependent protease
MDRPSKRTKPRPSRSIRELAPEQLRRAVDPASLGLDATDRLEPLVGIIGQKRALAALRFGLGIQGSGFNVYVAGPPGIGKMTAVQSFLEELARTKATPSDWCYVNNFEDAYQPKALRLPAGRGRALQAAVRSLIDQLRREILKAFESEEYGVKRDRIVKELEKEKAQFLERFAERATKEGFALEATPFGVALVPVREGRPLNENEFGALPAAARDEIDGRRDKLQDELKSAMKQVRELARAARERLRKVDRHVALFLVEGLIDDITEDFHDLPDVVAYLRALQKDVLENIETFKSGTATGPAAGLDVAPSVRPLLEEAPFRKYQVNVLVDNGRQSGAPVVVELNPSYAALFGRVEKETHLGTLSTDFTMIRSGSLHRANGGYLVLPVDDTLRNLFSWDGLKRSLRSREIQIEELGERLGFLATKSLRPEPIPLDVKVVLVGLPILYQLLHAYEGDFPELFKVKADFDTRMDWTDENARDFAAFLCTVCTKEGLLHVDSGATAKLLEHAARLAEDREKLSTHFGALADLLREANHWARDGGAAQVGAAHVRKALDEKVYRSSLVRERIQEMIARGTLLIDSEGASVGQVNGLSVLHLGDYMFGRPSRITATVGPGREGIIDLEREVETGGPIHSKGVMILSGYFAQNYAQRRPLTLSARLVFEQSYDGVEGDSASCAELYALLSALSGLPIRQGIAVTGSVNQRGEVQAIGGVNEKVEGFFDVCREKGLTGEQGVIIPASNVPHLMLRDDVVQAARDGRFHLWAAETVDEGIEILTGTPAGARGRDGQFPKGTVGDLVEKRLAEFGERLRPPAPTRSGARGKRPGPAPRRRPR